MPSGRLTEYTDKISKEVIERISNGESLSSICRSDGIPAKGTVLGWVTDDREGFADRYAKACVTRSYYWADEIIDIADDGTNDFMERKDGSQGIDGDAIARSRLRVDSRKWILSKLLPNQYGDKIEQKTDNTEALTEILNQLVNKLPD